MCVCVCVCVMGDICEGVMSGVYPKLCLFAQHKPESQIFHFQIRNANARCFKRTRISNYTTYVTSHKAHLITTKRVLYVLNYARSCALLLWLQLVWHGHNLV